MLLSRCLRLGIGIGATIGTLGSALAAVFASGVKFAPQAIVGEASAVGIYILSNTACATVEFPTGACVVGFVAQQSIGAITLHAAANFEQVLHASYAAVLAVLVGCSILSALLLVDEGVRGVRQCCARRRAPAGLPVQTESITWT